MGILPLKKRVNRNKCSFATKLRMFVVFAIDEFICSSAHALCATLVWVQTKKQGLLIRRVHF